MDIQMLNLENEKSIHITNLCSSIQDGVKLDPDLCLVTYDGKKIFTHKLIFNLFSETLKHVFNDLPTHTEIATMYIPTDCETAVLNLIKMLTEGFVLSTESEELVEVANIAEILGITLAGLQMGKRKKGRVTLNESVQSSIREERIIDRPRDNEDNDEDVSTNDDHDETEFQLEEKVQENEEDFIESESHLELSVDVQLENKGPKGKRECTECGKMFPHKQAYVHHMLIHSGEKPFQCDLCSKSFRAPYAFNQHKMTHNEVNPFTCELCENSFSTKHSLKRHLIRVHKSNQN